MSEHYAYYSCLHCRLILHEQHRCCPHCGALFRSAKPVSLLRKIVAFLSVLFLSALILPLALAGTCLLILARSSGADAMMLLYSLWCFAAIVLCVYGIRKLTR